MSQHNQQDQSKELIIKLGHREVTIRRQYKTASIINDFLIALWFTLGSIFFSIIRRRWPPYGCSLSAVRNFFDHPAQPPGAFAIDYRKHMGMLEQGTAPGVYDRYACTADAHLDRPG
jgi:hypothetical protein